MAKKGTLVACEGTELHTIVGGLVLDPYEGRSAFEDTGTASQLPGFVTGDIPVEANAGRNDQEAAGCAADIVGGIVLEGQSVKRRVIGELVLVGGIIETNTISQREGRCNAAFILCEEAQVRCAGIGPGESGAFQRRIGLVVVGCGLPCQEGIEAAELVTAVPTGSEGVLVFLIAILCSESDLMSSLIQAEDIRQLVGVHVQGVVVGVGLDNRRW